MGKFSKIFNDLPLSKGLKNSKSSKDYFTCANRVSKTDARVLDLFTGQQDINIEKEVPVIGSYTYKHFLEILKKFVEKQKSSLYISQILEILQSEPPPEYKGDVKVFSDTISEQKSINIDNKSSNKKNKKNKKEKKPGQSIRALQFIAKNRAEKLKSLFEEFLRTLSFTNRRDILLKPLQNEPVEFRLLRLLLSSQFIESNEWLMLCFKTIKHAYNYDGVSLLAIYHLKKMGEFVLHNSQFSFKKLDENSPHLIVSNNSMLDTLNNIKLRDFQKEMKSIPLFNGKGMLVLLQAMIGSGKTIAAISYFKKIAELCQEKYARNQNRKKNTEEEVYPQIFYVCPVPEVRQQLITLCNNTNIGFSVADWDKNKPKIHTSPLCIKESGKKNKKKTTIIIPVIICDLLSALYLLLEKSKEELDKTVIFFDEPTVSADQEDSDVTLLVSSILYETSPYLILSSATLPKPDEISPVIQHFKSKYPDGDVVSIKAMKSQIGCQLVTLDGELIAPHTTCKSKQDIKMLIKRLKEEVFVGRLYSPRMVFLLEETMRKYSKDVFDIDKHFLDNPTSLSHHSFVECLIKLLERLSEKDNEIIKEVCNATLQNNQEDQKELSIPSFLTHQINRFDKPTLIASTNPISIAKEMLYGLINDTSDLEKKLDSSIKGYKANLTKRQKSLDKINKLKSRDLRAIQIENIMKENIIPDISFLNGIIPYSKRYGCDFTEIVDELGVQNWLILLLFAGVGVCGNVPELTSSYSNLVSKMASNGRLRYIISDDSIIYGTSWPIGIVVCLDDIADKHSIASLMQLFGRAGRVGKSYTAVAYASNRVHKRIIDFIMGKESTGTALEAKNICLAFDKYQKIKSKYI